MNALLRALRIPALTLAPMIFAACGGAAETAQDDLLAESTSLALASEDGTMDGSTDAAMGGMDETTMADGAEESVDSALDQEPGELSVTCDFSGMREQIVARFDENGDGVLDAEERAAVREELENRPRARAALHRLLGGHRPRFHLYARVRWAFDADSDGQLSDEERAEMVAALEARCQLRKAEFLERYDANGDGSISPAELAAAVREARAAFQAKKAELLAEWDANGDGTLDEAERALAKAEARERLQTRRAEIRAQFDANGDGELDDAEKAALKAAVRQRIAEGVERAF